MNCYIPQRKRYKGVKGVEDIKKSVEDLQKKLERIEDSNVKEVLNGILSLLGSIDTILDELSDQISVIDEDLSELGSSYQTDEEFVSVKCVHCGEEFFVAASDYRDGSEVVCPNCGKINIIRL